MFNIWNSGTNVWTRHFMSILALCLHSIMNYTKSKHVVRTNSICFLPGPSALALFWDIKSQTCCMNILGPYPKGPTLTALNRLSHCLRHISLNLIPMYVLISIVIPVDAMLYDYYCSKCMYKHLMNYISPQLLSCDTWWNICMSGWFDGQKFMSLK